MNIQQYEINFWKQYLLLEKEFISTTLYVNLDAANYSTYSSAYVKLMLEIGSEIDNVMREMCNKTQESNIGDYAPILLCKYPDITNQVVKIKNNSILVIPFAGWNTSKPSISLCFWNAYNAVKHNRIANYQKASLENTIKALAGLFILEMYRFYELYCAEQDAFSSLPGTESDLLILDKWDQHVRFTKVKSPYSLIDDENNQTRII